MIKMENNFCLAKVDNCHNILLKDMINNICYPWQTRKAEEWETFHSLLLAPKDARNAEETIPLDDVRKEFTKKLRDQLNDYETKMSELGPAVTFDDVQNYMDTTLMLAMIPHWKHNYRENMKTSYKFIDQLLKNLHAKGINTSLIKLKFRHLMCDVYSIRVKNHKKETKQNLRDTWNVFHMFKDETVNEATRTWMKLSKVEADREMCRQIIHHHRCTFIGYSPTVFISGEECTPHITKTKSKLINLSFFGKQYLDSIVAYRSDLLNIVGENGIFPVICCALEVANVAKLLGNAPLVQYAFGACGIVMPPNTKKNVGMFENYDLIHLLANIVIGYLDLAYSRLTHVCHGIFNLSGALMFQESVNTKGEHNNDFRKILEDIEQFMEFPITKIDYSRLLTDDEESIDTIGICKKYFDKIKKLVDLFEDTKKDLNLILKNYK